MGQRENRCKCGDAFGNLLTEIDFIKDRAKDEKFPPITDFTSLISGIYANMRKTEEFCELDLRRPMSLYGEVSEGVTTMKIAKSEDEFLSGKNRTLVNLNIIRGNVRNKVEECSKG